MSQVPKVGWHSIRVIDISALASWTNFLAEPDWEAENDVSAWLAASNPLHYVPRFDGFGLMQLACTYLSAENFVIGALDNSRVDIELVSVREVPNLPTGRELVRWASEVYIAGDSELTLDLKFSEEIGTRVVALQDPPAGTAKISINTRLA